MKKLFLILYFFSKIEYSLAHTETITVFIHGTVQAGLAFVHPKALMHDTFKENCLYDRAMKKARANGYMYKSDIMLNLGLTDLTQLVLGAQVPPEHNHTAALHILRAFHHVAMATQGEHKRSYYLFGWEGKLSEKNREYWSEQLYNTLVALKKEHEAQGNRIIFELHSHSHGGQLIFHLPKIRESHKDKLFIDRALLSAAPIYLEKACNATSDMFGSLINLYSEGDRIQTADRFSTPGHCCHRSLAQLPLAFDDSPVKSIDARMLMRGKKNIFGHACFFILDRYYLSPGLPQFNALKAIIKKISPFPLVVLSPALIPSLQEHMRSSKHAYHSCDINIIIQQGKLAAAITYYQKNNPTVTELIYLPETELALSQKEISNAYTGTRYISEFGKALRGFWGMITSIGHKKHA